MNPIQNKIKSWLLNSDICNSSGGVYSWINPAHTGYIYPEIMGYYLSFLTQLYEKEIDLNNKNFFIGKTIKHINYLNQLLEAGGIGREQILYTFDTGICLTGLLRVKKIYQDENKELNNCINNMILFV